MRCIDADALKNIHGMKDDCAECDKELRHKSRSCEFDRVYTLMDFCGWIDDAPTIEPERKVGKWILGGYDDMYYVCSRCGYKRSEYYAKPKAKYCEDCGTKMEYSGELNV